MSTQTNEAEISENTSNTTNIDNIMLNEQTSPPAEEEEKENKKFKRNTAFYQEKTYTLASTKEKRVYKSSITETKKPDTLQDMIIDLEDTSLTEKDRIYQESFVSVMNLNQNLVDQLDKSIHNEFEAFIIELAQYHLSNTKEWRKRMRPLFKKYPKIGVPKKAAMRRVYLNLLRLKKINKNQELEKYLIVKASRTKSGVMVVTVLTSPYPKIGKKLQKFSCKHNCYYCPNEPDMPRSYLSDEPAVQRAWKHHWSAIEQFYARLWTYYLNGHVVDKIELLILGGTWSEYPIQYQEEFIRDCFYAANTFYNYMDLIDELSQQECKNKIRLKKGLIEEQKMNENCQCRIIGITLETRPDSINKKELQQLRYYGCTRVQIGIQHTNDKILKKINRGCLNKDAIHCVKLLKNVGFKLDFHLMPDLPGSTIELDEEMFYFVLNSSQIQADQWKIYPCQTTKYTIIKKWFESGEYKPFSAEELLNLLIKVKNHVHPWIRLNRVIRDIPNQYILAGNEVTNLRQFLAKEMIEKGGKCACIRCREIRGKQLDYNDKKNEIILKIRSYESSDGIEYFISFETFNEEIIFGFVRLRICNDFEIVKDIFPELVDCAMIRELHVYGQMIPVHMFNKDKKITQHIGFGKKLMNVAEIISVLNGYKQVSVIAGVGTRNYYRTIGYKLKGTYMIKKLSNIDYYKYLFCNTLKLVKTQIPYQEIVDKLKNKTNYDCSLKKSMEVENDLVVKHYVIHKSIIGTYLLNLNVFVLLIALVIAIVWVLWNKLNTNF